MERSGPGAAPAVGPGPAPGSVPGRPLAQRAAHDAQVLGDPSHRRPRCRLVQVHRLAAELLGAALPSHAQIISLSPARRPESACPNNGGKPPSRISPEQEKEILEALSRPPSEQGIAAEFWNIHDLAGWMHERFGIE